MKTARLTVLVEPSEKAAIEARAARHRLSTAEFVRRAVDQFDPEADPVLLQAVADELGVVVGRIEARMSAIEAGFASAEKRRAALRDEVRREVAARGEIWPFMPAAVEGRV